MWAHMGVSTPKEIVNPKNPIDVYP